MLLYTFYLRDNPRFHNSFKNEVCAVKTSIKKEYEKSYDLLKRVKNLCYNNFHHYSLSANKTED